MQMLLPIFSILPPGLPDLPRHRVNRAPITGYWYVGVDVNANVGTVAKWDGYQFGNSNGDDLDMTKYVYLKERP